MVTTSPMDWFLSKEIILQVTPLIIITMWEEPILLPTCIPSHHEYGETSWMGWNYSTVDVQGSKAVLNKFGFICTRSCKYTSVHFILYWWSWLLTQAVTTQITQSVPQDCVFPISAKYLLCEIGVVKSPHDNNFARLGWRTFCCEDDAFYGLDSLSHGIPGEGIIMPFRSTLPMAVFENPFVSALSNDLLVFPARPLLVSPSILCCVSLCAGISGFFSLSPFPHHCDFSCMAIVPVASFFSFILANLRWCQAADSCSLSVT